MTDGPKNRELVFPPPWHWWSSTEAGSRKKATQKREPQCGFRFPPSGSARPPHTDPRTHGQVISMKVLFLDVDGVLNNASTIQRYAMGIDPFLASLVRRVIVNTGCKIVLSSSWRLVKRGREQGDRQGGTPDVRNPKQ